MARYKRIFEPYYYPHNPNCWITIDNFFTPEECKEIIKVGESKEFKRAGIDGDNQYNDGHRKSDISWISQDDIEWFWVKIHNQIIETNHEQWGFNLKHFDEMAQYTVYNGDGGHFGYHYDNGAGQLSVRKISICINLNDPKEWKGGELQFYDEISAKQGLGSVHLFPSYMLHRVTPVTDGTRRSLVLWSGGEFYK